MSRRANNLKRMKEAKARRRRMSEDARHAEKSAYGQKPGSTIMGNRNTGSEGCITVVDKFTGEVRTGGSELIDEVIGNLARQQEEFLASDNPCYLVGRVKQNELAFDVGEIKRMVDATFECASRNCCDAWYPSQYALGLVHLMPGVAVIDVGHFLSNFELGLRTSGERAARHLANGDCLKESRQLAARLKDPKALEQLTDKDFRNIAAYVAGHPLFAAAMAWYEEGSGKKMRSGDDPGDGKSEQSRRSDTDGSGADECLKAQGTQDALADIRMWKGLVKSLGRDTVIDELVLGRVCVWLGSDTSHRLYIKASDAAEVRASLRSYTDDELGEWFSLMTTVALAETTSQVGLLWKEFGQDKPVLLVECPRLSELRTHFHLS